MNKLVILDRDGVINEDSDNYIKSPEEWIPIPGSIEAIATLNQAGFIVAVATNQSGIARGYYDVATLEAMHQKFLNLVKQAGGTIAHIAFCPHGPKDNCNCRKPKIGMVEEIEKVTGLSARGGWFVGDKWADIQCGLNAGCQPILVKTGKGEMTLKNHASDLKNVTLSKNLKHASERILLDI